jgi:hypothetical protein
MRLKSVKQYSQGHVGTSTTQTFCSSILPRHVFLTNSYFKQISFAPNSQKINYQLILYHRHLDSKDNRISFVIKSTKEREGRGKNPTLLNCYANE